MKSLYALFFAVVSFVVTPLAAAEPARVLLIVANGGAAADARPGFDMGELAQAYQIFTRNGFAVDIASAAGGKAVAEEFEADRPYNAAFVADASAMKQIAQTMAIADADPARYAALFLVGGSGAMFDFPAHEPLQRFIAALYERGGVIGGVCHGPAALVDVKLADGRHLIAGRRVSAFTEEEEALFGAASKSRYPFVLERAIRERKATFEESPMMLVQVSRDGRLVTGQNPFSTPRAVEEVIRASGRVPGPRDPYRDEVTIALIRELLGARSAAARAQLDATPAAYEASLIAMYGARLAGSASDDATLRRAVFLLEAGGRYFSHPKVRSALARTHLRLGEREQARLVLRAAAAEFPGVPAIDGMLEQLERESPHDSPEAPRAADRRPE